MDKTRKAVPVLRASAAHPCAPEPLIAVHFKGTFNHHTPYRGFHNEPVLALLMRGTGPYWVGPQKLPDTRPLATFLPPGDADVNGFVGPAESWYTNFRWPGLRTQSRPQDVIVSWGGRSIRLPRFKPIDGVTLAGSVEIFAALRTALARQDLPGSVCARALVMQLFQRYADLPDAGLAGLGHRALAQFRELLHARACDDVTIEQIADDAGVTADHLRELFRGRYGMRPLEYRTGLRMARARELLASTKLNVKQVAHQTGYPDALYFSRVFKEHFGISPRDMIRRFRLPGVQKTMNVE